MFSYISMYFVRKTRVIPDDDLIELKENIYIQALSVLQETLL